MNTYAMFHGFVVTAKPDGSIALNAQLICSYAPEPPQQTRTTRLVAQANAAIPMLDALCRVERWLDSRTALGTFAHKDAEAVRAAIAQAREAE
jgi:hypothetical protein